MFEALSIKIVTYGRDTMEQTNYLNVIIGLINKIIAFILNYWISKHLLLRSIFLMVGVLPFLYVIGYITLYGLYFGGAKASILSLALQYVPFNRFACVSVGLLLTGLTAFIWWIYVLFRDRKKQKLKLSLIVLVVTIFLIMLHGHLLLFFVTQDFFNIDNLLKFSLIWTGPVTLFIILSIMRVIRNLYGLVLVAGVIMLIVYFHLVRDVSEETFYPFFIIGTGILTALLKRDHSNAIGITWLITLIFTVVVTYMGCKTLGLEIYNNRWILLLLSIVLSYLLARVIYSTYQKRGRWLNKNKSETDSLRLRFSNILDIGLYYWSVVILLVAPLIIFIIFSTGSYIGETLKISTIFVSGAIRIGNQDILGNVVSNDDDYMYISTPQRTLVVVRPGSQSVVIK